MRYRDKAAGSDCNNPGCHQARAKIVANEKLMSPPPPPPVTALCSIAAVSFFRFRPAGLAYRWFCAAVTSSSVASAHYTCCACCIKRLDPSAHVHAGTGERFGYVQKIHLKTMYRKHY
jgi:hypothetical protein